MGNIFDYLDWCADLPMERDGFHEVDGVLLARLSYLPFEGMVSFSFLPSATIGEVAETLSSMPDIEKKVLWKEDVELLHRISKSRRFSPMGLCGYINRIDPQTQTQFAVITVQIAENLYYVAFRGTDNTLVGWKEDFNMGFTFPVPAQESAMAYFQELACFCPRGRFLLGGHSKGGNLAVYAATFCDPQLQDKIAAVYNYDGPGFGKQVMKTEAYQRICGKIHTFVPQSSVVGMLLEHEENYTIIHSKQIGILQHDIYSWEIQQGHFVSLDHVTNSSRLIDSTLKEWISEMDTSQREHLVDTVFQIMAQTNAVTWKDLSDNWVINTRILLKSAKGLDDSTRKVLIETLRSLVRAAHKGLFQMVLKP